MGPLPTPKVLLKANDCELWIIASLRGCSCVGADLKVTVSRRLGLRGCVRFKVEASRFRLL